MTGKFHRGRRPLVLRSAIGLAAAALLQPALAAELVNNDSLLLRWDNSVKYTLGARTTAASPTYTQGLNANDGDAAFPHAGDLMTKRLDVLSEFDLSAKDRANSGLRISVAGWYDQAYRQSHAAVNAASYNPTSVSNAEFTAYARKWAGANAEIYDAFVHSGFDLGGHNLSFRLGRHTLMWGESLLLGSNGIAAGQAPVDVNKVMTVPGIQTKDFFMPVNQLSGAFSLTPNWDLASYYQLEYRANRVPAPGTFFSPADVVYDGAERLLFGPGFGVAQAGFQKPPRQHGQYGLAAKYRDSQSGLDLGFYYLRYTDKSPQLVMDLINIPVAPFVVPGSYYFAYPQKIDVYGLSTSTHLGDANVAGEISIRDNTPLTSLATALSTFSRTSGGSDAPWATGRSLHVQASTLWTLPRMPGWDAATLVAEVGCNTLLSTGRNAAARDTNTSKTACAASANIEPTWYQALPDVDLSLPLALAYNFNGKTPAVASVNMAPHTGSASLGLKFVYANSIKGGLYYTKQLGSDTANAFGDRDFVTFNLNCSF